MTNIAIFGAGGRAGRAVTAEALQRGHSVTAVVRDPSRYGDIPGAVRGDVTDQASVSAIVPGHDAVVQAVSPASGPAELAALELDPDFFSKAAETLLHTGVPRLVAIGMYADLLDGNGRALLEDPGVLPVQFRAFALAHTAGLRRLRAAGQGGTDWVMLTPPAMLRVDGPRLGRYRIGGETAPSGELSYPDLATAVVDEIEQPRFHRTRVSVFN